MKTFCRALSCILITVMLLLSFAACGGEKKTTNAKSSEAPSTGGQEQSENSKDVPNIQKPEIHERFDGKTVKFCIDNPGVNSRSIDLTDGEDATYEVNAKVLERNEKIKKELGVTVELSKTVEGFTGAADHLLPIFASKVYTYDVIGLHQYLDLGLCLGESAGSFYNLQGKAMKDAGSYLNIDAPYWNKDLLDSLSYKDTAFVITGDLNQTYVGSMFVSFVNTKMWNEWKDKIAALPSAGGIGDVYELIEKGYWTLDLWMEICRLVYEDTNKNGQVDGEDRVGFMTYNSDVHNTMPDMLAAGSHVVYSEKEESGVPKMAFDSKHNLDFAGKLYTLLCESNVATIPYLSSEEGAGNTVLKTFAKGKVLMNVESLCSAEDHLQEMKEDYYILPLPMFDRNQFETVGYTSQLRDSVNQYAICTAIGKERVPLVTATLELLGYYSKELVTPAYYDALSKGRYTTDEKTAEMIDLVREGVYNDFAHAWSGKIQYMTYFRTAFNEKNARTRLIQMKKHQDTYSKNLGYLSADFDKACSLEG